MVEIAHLIGRVIFGGFFIYNGLNHLGLRTETLTEYAEGKGVAAPRTMVLLGGVLLLVGGTSILLAVMPHWGAVFLLAFLVPVSITMHPFWKEEGAMRETDQANFYKNMALVGALLMIMAIPRPWPYGLFG